MANDQQKLYRAIEDWMERERDAHPTEELTDERLRDFLDTDTDSDTLKTVLRDRDAVKRLVAMNEPITIAEDDPDEPMSREAVDASLAEIMGGAKTEQNTVDFQPAPAAAAKSKLSVRWRAHIFWAAACAAIAWFGLIRSPGTDQPFIADSSEILRTYDDTLRSGDLVELTGRGKLLDILLINRHRDYAQYVITIRQGDRELAVLSVDGPRDSLPLHLPRRFFDAPGSYQLDIIGRLDGTDVPITRYNLDVPTF